ncbi:MAG: 2-oxoacid:acceptor oxidoreductase family protein [Erysipelotrichaceae bacterium]|jgi:2-oxoglutarate ferredoxin oxidoreductase subunit gamma|nr:2-oxoacid:acceptor oxidoreductase family protein [Bacillota bacterium]MBQ1380276.1 2-oxoacid:acceptor oxidoreductase family protein [Erysipelotrichaceae bacterium]MBQ1566769.1 2-oxoacid:acceptor oxidoreductase family protein [Erysipelotrichaceae bacterium]MBQ1775048.1 2-oxoacid:acceptor oxidoreductase family protein [Erysipelotrichaceae bacterium]MBQ2505683.1 2-oxoacid:acceptor oxidoreductase family protein [Erysipelotrichaceae bacterium]
MDNFQLRFAGTGGQGMMLIGDLMAYYYGIIADKQIVLLKSYGPEARGGACRSELIVDEEECYPAVTCPDLLLAMSEQSYHLYTEDIDQDTIILVDSDLVKDADLNHPHTYQVPLTAIAKETTGKTICANIVALGVMTKLLKIAPEEMLEVLKTKLPARILEINLQAFQAGYEVAL